MENSQNNPDLLGGTEVSAKYHQISFVRNQVSASFPLFVGFIVIFTRMFD